MTVDRLGEEMVELSPALRRFVPPALVIDKWIYSPWLGSDLDRKLKARGIDTVIVSGGETDVCVLATVLGAIDLGYRVIVATDAICSSADRAARRGGRPLSRPVRHAGRDGRGRNHPPPLALTD